MFLDSLNSAARKDISYLGQGLFDELLLKAHICVLQNKSTKKSIEKFEYLIFLIE